MADGPKWRHLTQAKMTPAEEETVNNILRAVLDDESNVGTVVGYTDESKSATLTTINVIIVDETNTFLATIYDHPGRMVVATLPAPKRESAPAADKSDIASLIAEFDS